MHHLTHTHSCNREGEREAGSRLAFLSWLAHGRRRAVENPDSRRPKTRSLSLPFVISSLRSSLRRHEREATLTAVELSGVNGSLPLLSLLAISCHSIPCRSLFSFFFLAFFALKKGSKRKAEIQVSYPGMMLYPMRRMLWFCERKEKFRSERRTWGVL